ncbi:magnesium/cobalt transporter CorA [Staphylococcus sp. EZ-P03]|uniref:magnesium/cobalt transporter CorA n=1 Tax=Staphylococcus sp. EZ-P03 TaxID=2282739 RepID=UPI000DF74E35|nr:magnesium/cobalt transporter CorA [Staphylococcus sp. EZ-P03]
MSMSIYYQTKSQGLTKAPTSQAVPKDATVVWYDINEPTKEDNQCLLNDFDFNPLEVDDTIHANPRAKYKNYQSYQNVVFHRINADDFKIQVLNIFIKDNLLITYHHHKIEEIDTVLKQVKAHYDQDLDCEDIVLYILDHIVDNYFKYVDDLSDKVFTFEDEHGTDRSNKYMMDHLFDLRSDMIKMNRVIMPMKELIDTLEYSSGLVQDKRHKMYIQHIKDHIAKEESMLKTAQDITREIRDNFESYTTYRMNRVMQILTIVSMIFMPLTLLAGIYGMNFEFMPELKWHYGYSMCLGLMVIITLWCIWFFKRKNML